MVDLVLMSAKSRWKVLTYEQDDLSEIEKFFKRIYSGYGTHGTIAYFHWKIIKNKVMPGIINLIRTSEGIGSIASLTPKELFIKGEKLIAAEIGDIPPRAF